MRQRIPERGDAHWLDQQGSYTAAAARLGVSKAAMSQRIAELERLAGVALVQRTTRSVRLTEAGEAWAKAMPYSRNGHSGYQILWNPAVTEQIREAA